MAMSLEDTLVSVWRQVMAEDGKTVTLNDERYPVRRTTRSKLREVDFKFEGRALRGVEQNASTSSRWAKLAQEGKKVMQFLSDGRYVANVVEGKATVYQSLRER
jgi:fructose-1,6-bisphosphatase/inositol monophosphatase family enzyme